MTNNKVNTQLKLALDEINKHIDHPDLVRQQPKKSERTKTVIQTGPETTDLAWTSLDADEREELYSFLRADAKDQ